MLWMNSTTRFRLLGKGEVAMTALSEKPGLMGFLTQPCAFVEGHPLAGRSVGIHDGLEDGAICEMVDAAAPDPLDLANFRPVTKISSTDSAG